MVNLNTNQLIKANEDLSLEELIDLLGWNKTTTYMLPYPSEPNVVKGNKNLQIMRAQLLSIRTHQDDFKGNDQCLVAEAVISLLIHDEMELLHKTEVGELLEDGIARYIRAKRMFEVDYDFRVHLAFPTETKQIAASLERLALPHIVAAKQQQQLAKISTEIDAWRGANGVISQLKKLGRLHFDVDVCIDSSDHDEIYLTLRAYVQIAVLSLQTEKVIIDSRDRMVSGFNAQEKIFIILGKNVAKLFYYLFRRSVAAAANVSFVNLPSVNTKTFGDLDYLIKSCTKRGSIQRLNKLNCSEFREKMYPLLSTDNLSNEQNEILKIVGFKLTNLYNGDMFETSPRLVKDIRTVTDYKILKDFDSKGESADLFTRRSFPMVWENFATVTLTPANPLKGSYLEIKDGTAEQQFGYMTKHCVDSMTLAYLRESISDDALKQKGSMSACMAPLAPEDNYKLRQFGALICYLDILRGGSLTPFVIYVSKFLDWRSRFYSLPPFDLQSSVLTRSLVTSMTEYKSSVENDSCLLAAIASEFKVSKVEFPTIRMHASQFPGAVSAEHIGNLVYTRVPTLPRERHPKVLSLLGSLSNLVNGNTAYPSIELDQTSSGLQIIGCLTNSVNLKAVTNITTPTPDNAYIDTPVKDVYQDVFLDMQAKCSSLDYESSLENVICTQDELTEFKLEKQAAQDVLRARRAQLKIEEILIAKPYSKQTAPTKIKLSKPEVKAQYDWMKEGDTRKNIEKLLQFTIKNCLSRKDIKSLLIPRLYGQEMKSATKIATKFIEKHYDSDIKYPEAWNVSSEKAFKDQLHPHIIGEVAFLLWKSFDETVNRLYPEISLFFGVAHFIASHCEELTWSVNPKTQIHMHSYKLKKKQVRVLRSAELTSQPTLTFKQILKKDNVPQEDKQAAMMVFNSAFVHSCDAAALERILFSLYKLNIPTVGIHDSLIISPVHVNTCLMVAQKAYEETMLYAQLEFSRLFESAVISYQRSKREPRALDVGNTSIENLLIVKEKTPWLLTNYAISRLTYEQLMNFKIRNPYTCVNGMLFFV